MYAQRAEAIEKELERKLFKAKTSLEESTTRLVGRTANSGKVKQRTTELRQSCHYRAFLRHLVRYFNSLVAKKGRYSGNTTTFADIPGVIFDVGPEVDNKRYRSQKSAGTSHRHEHAKNCFVLTLVFCSETTAPRWFNWKG